MSCLSYAAKSRGLGGGAPAAEALEERQQGDDQERIEAQAGLLGFKDTAEYIFRCAVLVTRRLEDWRELCREDDP